MNRNFHSDFPHRRRGNAFTLVEALVALGVFSFAVLGFLMAFDTTLGAAREVRREAMIRQILEDRIAWLEHAPLEPREARIDGPIPKMIIREEIAPERLVDESRNIYEGFWKVRVLVEWDRAGEKETMEAGFLRYGG